MNAGPIDWLREAAAFLLVLALLFGAGVLIMLAEGYRPAERARAEYANGAVCYGPPAAPAQTCIHPREED